MVARSSSASCAWAPVDCNLAAVGGHVSDCHVLCIEGVESLASVVHSAVDEFDEFLGGFVRILPGAHLALAMTSHRVATSASAGSAGVGYSSLLGNHVF